MRKMHWWYQYIFFVPYYIRSKANVFVSCVQSNFKAGTIDIMK
jgi:hypothetical protein